MPAAPTGQRRSGRCSAQPHCFQQNRWEEVWALFLAWCAHGCVCVCVKKGEPPTRWVFGFPVLSIPKERVPSKQDTLKCHPTPPQFLWLGCVKSNSWDPLQLVGNSLMVFNKKSLLVVSNRTPTRFFWLPIWECRQAPCHSSCQQRALG